MTTTMLDLRQSEGSEEQWLNDLNWVYQVPHSAIGKMLIAENDEELITGVIHSVKIVKRQQGRMMGGAEEGVYFTLDGYIVQIEPDYTVNITSRSGR